MKPDRQDELPLDPLLAEIAGFRQATQETLAALEARWAEELSQVEKAVEGLKTAEKVTGKLRDVRDMLTVVRSADLKPAKGRRKDLKKIESTLEDLQILIKNW